MTAPIDAYGQRAGMNPAPAGYTVDWSTAHLTVDAADEAQAASGYALWADISEYQTPVNSLYPYQQLTIRLDTGGRLDKHAQTNHTAWLKLKRTGFLSGYMVFIPGQSAAILKRVQGAFGKQLEGIAPMVDVEAGKGFAGPGNHSAEANDFVNELDSATGNIAREIGYANSPDWGSCWPSRGHLQHRVVADYSATMQPGYWAQQYYGGLNYPTPTGFPRACAPFGSWVDMNAAASATDTLLDDLGLDWLSMANEAQVQAAAQAGAEAALKALLPTLITDAGIKSENSGQVSPLWQFLQVCDRRTYQTQNALTALAKATLQPAEFTAFQTALNSSAVKAVAPQEES